MSITVVNGFVCTSGCDEAKARQGKDPNAPPGTPPGDDRKASALGDRPAAVLGGALKDIANAVRAASGSAAVGNDTRSPAVNRLV